MPLDIKKILSSKKDIIRGYIRQQIEPKIKAQVADLIKLRFEASQDFGDGFGITKRRNKTVVEGGFRNTVDLRNLIDSMSLEFEDNSSSAGIYNSRLRVLFSVDYADYVLLGFVTSKGNIVPDRLILLENIKEDLNL